MKKRVVITGMGTVNPIGNNIEEFQKMLIKGKSGIKFIKELEDFEFSCCVGGVPEIRNSENFHYLEKYKLTEADNSIQYLVLAGIEAWLSAGFDLPDYYSTDVYDDFGAIIGTCTGGMEMFARKLYPKVTEGKAKRLGSTINENTMPSGGVSILSQILSLANQTTTISSACATGTEAVIHAYERIQNGKATLMLAGGSEGYSPYCWAGFEAIRVLTNEYNNNPKAASRPMSESASGFVPAAGAGVLVLEELKSALKRNAKIYGEIVAGNINSGGQRNGGSMTAPNSTNVVKCIKDCIAQANIKPNEIDLIGGHLTGTIADPIEVQNWIDALELKNNFPYLNTIKSITGHLIGAAGAVEIIACLLQISNKYIHKNLNCEDLHPKIKSIYEKHKIPTETILDIDTNYCIKANFGFGDVNSCIILKKYS